MYGWGNTTHPADFQKISRCDLKRHGIFLRIAIYCNHCGWSMDINYQWWFPIAMFGRRFLTNSPSTTYPYYHITVYHWKNWYPYWYYPSWSYVDYHVISNGGFLKWIVPLTIIHLRFGYFPRKKHNPFNGYPHGHGNHHHVGITHLGVLTHLAIYMISI